MRDDELRRLLTGANPWWNAVSQGVDPTAWVASHRLLTGRRKFDLGHRTNVLSDIAADSLEDSLVVLNGPRRIGKSVALVDTIAGMCARKDVDPRQLIHVPCDGMRDRDLRRVITLGRSLTASVDDGMSRRRAWFFDEISAVPGWTSIVKQARDLTEFGDDTVIATGSRWTGNAEIHGHLMAGRAGSSGRRRIRQLLPMSFREYLAVTNPDLPRPGPIPPADLVSEDARNTLAPLVFLADHYDLAWQDYLTCGGFPRAVAEYTKSGGVSGDFAKDLLGWLRIDIDQDAPQESIPLLLVELAARMTSPLNVTNLAAALNYSGHDALERRLMRLTATHAAIRCHRRSDQGKSVARAQSKLYLVDPLLAWAPAQLNPGLRLPDFTKLNEAVLAVALARCVDGLDEGRWPDDDTIGYARTTSGGEIDFAPIRVPTGAGPAMTAPMESKWVDTGWRAEARAMDAKYGRGILATKSILDLDHRVWAVPAPLVALLLE